MHVTVRKGVSEKSRTHSGYPIWSTRTRAEAENLKARKLVRVVATDGGRAAYTFATLLDISMFSSYTGFKTKYCVIVCRWNGLAVLGNRKHPRGTASLCARVR